mgnify:CR=1 FL=1
MKIKFVVLAAVIIAWGCSAPKYASYHFDHHDYNSGRKQVDQVTAQSSSVSPLVLQESTLEASTASPSENIRDVKAVPALDKKAIADKVAAMSKSERKELKRDLKEVVKKIKDSKKDQSPQATAEMDHDLKLAAIFGAVGLVLTLFGGISTVFWVLGVIALVIGVVFLIKWLARQ